MIDRTHRSPWIATFDLADQLALLDLRGAWPTRAGASQKLATGPRTYAQSWAQTIYSQYAERGHIQGIIYPSAMLGGGACVALFNQAQSAIPDAPTGNEPLQHPALLPAVKRIAVHIGYGLA